MRLVLFKRTFLLLIILVFFGSSLVYAGQIFPFPGRINADNVNIRSDSRANSEVVSTLRRGECLEVAGELYDWYKIRLPKSAASFIRQDMVSPISELPPPNDNISPANVLSRTAKVAKDNVNIRLNPSESSAILGRVHKNEVVKVLGDKGGWYKIEPVNNSFGWVHKKFVEKSSDCQERILKPAEPIEKKTEASKTPVLAEQNTVIEGIVRPYGKIFKRVATHKLVLGDKKILLLKGNKDILNGVNYHKVRITGKIISDIKQKIPIIEVVKVEALD